jgi:hypothetical protein
MTTLDNPHAPARSPWDDDLWEILLASIARDRVIPIIGPALSMVEVDGQRTTVDRYVAGQLARRLALETSALPDDFGLDAVVCEHLRRRGRLEELYPRVNAILRNAQFEAPPALVKLARIPNFRLFVTTAYDSLLEAAIDRVRGAGARASESIGYVPSEMPDCDLQVSAKKMALTTVYHLLGKASALPEFIISDEDLLEYVVALQSERRPVNLFDELSRHHLLILGGNFPDWLFRLFLRLVKRQRLSERPMGDREVVADHRSHDDHALVTFLSNFSPQTQVFAGGPESFVDELYSRWSQLYGEADPKQDQQGVIFISYASEDFAAASTLASALEAQRFRVWFDKSQLQGGVDFDYKIREAIKSSSVFMPIISRNTERDREKAYFRLEWSLADELDRRNSESVRFIVPVVIDETPRGDLREVPANFMRKHILAVEGGAPTNELISALRAALDGQR